MHDGSEGATRIYLSSPCLKAFRGALFCRLPRADLVRRAAPQSLMRPILVVPDAVRLERAPHPGLAERRPPAASESFFLQRANESLDDGDRALLSDGAEGDADALLRRSTCQCKVDLTLRRGNPSAHCAIFDSRPLSRSSLSDNRAAILAGVAVVRVDWRGASEGRTPCCYSASRASAAKMRRSASSSCVSTSCSESRSVRKPRRASLVSRSASFATRHA
jgi:hypothetical protein